MLTVTWLLLLCLFTQFGCLRDRVNRIKMLRMHSELLENRYHWMLWNVNICKFFVFICILNLTFLQCLSRSLGHIILSQKKKFLNSKKPMHILYIFKWVHCLQNKVKFFILINKNVCLKTKKKHRIICNRSLFHYLLHFSHLNRM